MKRIVLFIWMFTLLSCGAQKREVIAKSTIKLEGKNTGIRKLIEIDGYYSLSLAPHLGSYMFFEDGTWVDFHFQRESTEEEKQRNMSKAVTSWIEDKKMRRGSYWGVYKIEEDTLVVYSYDKGTLWKGWSLSEEKFKIIDRQNINRIYYKGLLKADGQDGRPWFNGELMYFTPADSLPCPDNWLKEEKWIWRNESDWKAYMKKIEKK